MDMKEFFKSFEQLTQEKKQDPNWQENNLEYDLCNTDWIIEKVKQSDIYAQNLYAALCNNDFIKNDVWPILQHETWACSWRYAGGIIADMRNEGDYMDWYCSSSLRDINNMVAESIVTDEIREDLKNLGWLVVDSNN